MNQQREVVYSLRLFALERGEELKAEAQRMIEAAVERTARQFLGGAARPEEFDRGGLRELLMLQYLVNPEKVLDAGQTPDLDAILAAVRAEGDATFGRKIEYLQEFGRADRRRARSTRRCCRR